MSSSLKLGITKIGDLLLENKITEINEGEDIANMKLTIPPYQRPYKWLPKNVIQLFDDIAEAKNENREVYRVGTLILQEEDNKTIYNIVDGQQRIITFCLLLKALGIDEKNTFLKQPLANNHHNKQNIPDNFLTLKRRVNNIIDVNEREKFLDFVKKNCELIVVITEDISEAFQFFDSQNVRGKKLYPHDLLKAYHLREMNDLDILETEKVVKIWEDLKQKKLSSLFSEYLYRVKEWLRGNRAEELTEHNIQKFKGIRRVDNFPYAQFYKGALAYSETINFSSMPFVSGIKNLKSFQLDTPIIAGKAFFDYAKYYYIILEDIQNNDKYEGYYINDNKIVKTLDLPVNKNGVGNGIARFLFDTAILLYVDRFCPERMTKTDQEMLDRFVIFAFIWAYSLRAQYVNLGWQSAQNYIMKTIKAGDVVNSFNVYKIIAESDSPVSLLRDLSDEIKIIPIDKIRKMPDKIDDREEDGTYKFYHFYFKDYNFLEGLNE